MAAPGGALAQHGIEQHGTGHGNHPSHHGQHRHQGLGALRPRGAHIARQQQGQRQTPRDRQRERRQGKRPAIGQPKQGGKRGSLGHGWRSFWEIHNILSAYI